MDQQGLHCEVCNAQLPNFQSMQHHLGGKRHQNALMFWEKRSAQARHCLFVRGFPGGTTEQELWGYFSQFGRITKVSLVQPQGMYAIIEYSTPDTVQYVLNTPNHKLNSCPLLVKPREVQAPGKLPTNKYQQGYQQFQGGRPLGAGRGGAPGRGGGRGGGPRSLLNLAGYGGGAPANETWFDQGLPAAKRAVLDDEVEVYYHEELMEKLINVKGVQNQLEWLCQNLQVTADEAQTKFTMCEQLQGLLGKFFPGCTVNQFGSSVNGFGLTGCDMDIFLDLSTMSNDNWQVQPVKLPYIRDLKQLKEKEWGPLKPQDLGWMALLDQCKLVSRILGDNMEGITDIQVMPSNRCPVVRFRGGASDIKCDLSVNNKMALQNTKLLYLYSVLNSRVRLLVYAIRYWGKIKGIAGGINATARLSNYSLTLMVLVYLQNVEPQVLPTIEQLSLLHGPSNRTKIEAWDVTFAMDWQIIPQSNNTQTPAELLSGFFAYWSAFDFSNCVLITRTATAMSFADFLEKDNMKDGRVRNFKTTAISMQDPFVLDHNVTQNVSEKMCEKIQRELRIAAIKTSMWCNDGFSMSGASSGGDLIHLLDSELPDVIKLEEEEKKKEIAVKSQMPRRLPPGQKYQFEIALKPSQLNSRLLKQLQKQPNYRVEWCRKTCKFMIRVLKEIVMVNLEDLPEATEEDLTTEEQEQKKVAAIKKHNMDVRERRRERRKQREAERARKAEEGETMETNEGGDASTGEKRSREEEGPQASKKLRSLADMPMEDASTGDANTGDADSEGEEIIRYERNEKKLRFKQPTDKEIDEQYFMRAWCCTWARRKKVKTYLRGQGYNQEEGIALEKLMSEAIWKEDNAPYNRPFIGYYCFLESEVDDKETKIIVTMDPTEGHIAFMTFFQWFKIYFGKLMDKHFN